MTMTDCPKCGSPLSDDAKYCLGCGARITDAADPQSGASTEIPASNQFTPPTYTQFAPPPYTQCPPYPPQPPMYVQAPPTVQNVPQEPFDYRYQMYWYKALIYGVLIIGGLLSIAMGLYLFIIGIQASSYRYSGGAIVSILLGLAFCAVGVVGYVARFMLANYRAVGITLLHVHTALAFGVPALIFFIAAVAAGGSRYTSYYSWQYFILAIGATLLGGYVIWLNSVYFKNRRHMFR